MHGVFPRGSRGNSRRAVFVHGAGGGAWEWNIWCRVFESRSWAATAIELQPVADGLQHTRFSDYQAQVQRALDGHCAAGDKPVLVGASLGGLLALASTDHASALVLVNPLPAAPWHDGLALTSRYPDIVPWRAKGRLETTIAAMPDADESARLYAFRQWRNESGAVLNEARDGIQVAVPGCATLIMASRDDESIARSAMFGMATGFACSFLNVEGQHLSPLLGNAAADCALLAVEWLNVQLGFTGR